MLWVFPSWDACQQLWCLVPLPLSFQQRWAVLGLAQTRGPCAALPGWGCTHRPAEQQEMAQQSL